MSELAAIALDRQSRTTELHEGSNLTTPRHCAAKSCLTVLACADRAQEHFCTCTCLALASLEAVAVLVSVLQRGAQRRLHALSIPITPWKARVPVSRSPFSGLSLPWTTLRPVCTARSPLMVPGSASKGFVAPMSFLADFTTPSPSHTCKHCRQTLVNLSQRGLHSWPICTARSPLMVCGSASRDLWRLLFFLADCISPLPSHTPERMVSRRCCETCCH